MNIPAEKLPETPAGKVPEVKVTFVAGGVPGLNVYNIDVNGLLTQMFCAFEPTADVKVKVGATHAFAVQVCEEDVKQVPTPPIGVMFILTISLELKPVIVNGLLIVPALIKVPALTV
mgnify:CR=1 FL=1